MAVWVLAASCQAGVTCYDHHCHDGHEEEADLGGHGGVGTRRTLRPYSLPVTEESNAQD